MIDDVGIFRNEGPGLVLNEFDAGNDGRSELLQLRVVFPGNVINDAVNIALGVKIVGRHPHELRALLPGKIVLPSNVRQALRLNGVKDGIADGQDEIGGC